MAKENERARWRCPKCNAVWVYHEPRCIICGTIGIALNKRAERILKNRGEENDERS